MVELFFEVKEIGSTKRIDLFISQETPDISRNKVQSLINEGCVFVNGDLVSKPSLKIKTNDMVKIIIKPTKELSAEPQDIPLEIVYEDEDMVIVNKQRGLVAHPAAGNQDGTLVNALMFHIKNLSSINGTVRPGIIHRLDKNTTGLLVVAKNDRAHLSIAKQFEKRTVIKKYIALVHGRIKKDEGCIDVPIGRNPKDRKKMAVVSNGKPAKTGYKVLQQFDKYSLVEYTLFTGRTHQIRVHSNYIKCPIVGDFQYGAPANNFNIEGQLLHSSYLEFKHPSTKERVSCYAEIPEDFKNVLNKIS